MKPKEEIKLFGGWDHGDTFYSEDWSRSANKLAASGVSLWKDRGWNHREIFWAVRDRRTSQTEQWLQICLLVIQNTQTEIPRRNQQENHVTEVSVHTNTPANTHLMTFHVLWTGSWLFPQTSQNLPGFHHSPPECNVKNNKTSVLSTYKLKYSQKTISSHVLRVHVGHWCYKHR